MPKETYAVEGQRLRESVITAIKKHTQSARDNLDLIAGENVSSPSVCLALASDLVQRYTFHGFYDAYDEMEALISERFRTHLGAEYANIRPLTGNIANLVSYLALTNFNDHIMAVDMPHGGHESFAEWGAAGIAGLKVHPIPFKDDVIIDTDMLAQQAEAIRPSLVILGTTSFLFPHPVAEVVSIARENNIRVMYDAAHVFGLIVGGCFQNPIKNAVDIMTTSTHKTFPGPQGGIIFSKNAHSEKVHKIMEEKFGNQHPNRIPALGIALAEMLAFGHEYANQMILNAKALAQGLQENGLDVLFSDRGFTETHQVLLDVSQIGGGRICRDKLKRAGILSSCAPIPKDAGTTTESGIRIGSTEPTRLGMKPSEMSEISVFIRRALLEEQDPEKVRRQVVEFKGQFQKVHFCFDELSEAYQEYFSAIVKGKIDSPA